MAERDELSGPLRGHDPRNLRRHERVALREGAKPLGRLRRHADEGAGPREPVALGLPAHVDHADAARVVDVAQVVAHRR
jgi:hypothetical protein